MRNPFLVSLDPSGTPTMHERVAPYAPPVRWAELLVLGVGILTLVLLFEVFPDRSGLRSPRETQQVLARLGVQWRHPGPPVVILDSRDDRTIGVLLESLDAAGIPYEVANVDGNRSVEQVLAEISKARSGRRCPPYLPTVIVGTRVIHDVDPMDAISRAYRRQHGWRGIG